MKVLLLVILGALTLTVSGASALDIHRSHSGGRTFYNFQLILTPANSTLIEPAQLHNRKWPNEGLSTPDELACFEVYIRKSSFPIEAPQSGEWIILRMPGTLDNDPSFMEKRRTKVALWEQLKAMYDTGKGSEPVVIELSEYIRVVDPQVPIITLDGINIWFRCAHGAYVPYVGELRPTEHASN